MTRQETIRWLNGRLLAEMGEYCAQAVQFLQNEFAHSAGFDKNRLFYTQGDYGLFQCSEPCCQETWDNEESVRRMIEQQADLGIPSDLIPRCPRCGRELTMNLRSGGRFVEDDGWHAAARRYSEFLLRHKGMSLVFLELGVGYNTLGIIKYPFWQMTAENPRAVYA